MQICCLCFTFNVGHQYFPFTMISSTICAAAMKKQAHLESLFAFLRLHIATAFLHRKQTLFSFEHSLSATRHNFLRFVIVKKE